MQIMKQISYQALIYGSIRTLEKNQDQKLLSVQNKIPIKTCPMVDRTDIRNFESQSNLFSELQIFNAIFYSKYLLLPEK